MKKYKLLIFDMGGTIVKPILLNKCLNMSFLTDCVNESLTSEQIENIEIFFNNMRDTIHSNHNRQFEISIKNQLVASFNRFNLTPSKSIEEIEQEVVFGNTAFRQPENSDMLFNYIICNNVNTCVLSNSEVSSELLLKILDKMYPLVGFSRVYSSADLLFRKPSTEMAKKILEDFHLFPQDCCIIGNSAEDVAVANSLNMDCYLVGDKKIDEGMNYTSVRNLNSLLQYIC